MRLERQIKMLAALEVTLVSFTAWTALVSLLLKELADYRLFFLSLGLIFLMQFIYVRKSNKFFASVLPFAVSIPFLIFLLNSTEILSNLVFIFISLFLNIKLEDLAIEYEEYRLKAKQGAAILGVIALVSLWMDKETADYIYRFVVNYIIAAVVLLRESRAYCYKVVKDHNNTEKTKPLGFIKGLVTDMFFKYGIVIVSTLVLSTDWILSKSIGIISAFSKAANFIIGGILDIVRGIVGPILVFAVDRLRRVFSGTTFSMRLEELKEGLKILLKNVDLENGGATAADEILLYSTLKAVAFLIIVLFILDAVYKIKFLKHKSEQYVEEKEKIYRDKDEHKSSSVKSSITELFKKVFKGNRTLKDKILSLYRDFERAAFKAEIYKPHMTATELKDRTQLIVPDSPYLEEMTEAYNEVKFSRLEPKENQLDLMKIAVEDVKKQIGKSI